MTVPSPDAPALVRDAGDPADEDAALHAGALLVDHSARARWVFRGAGARATLNGLVTNDVAALAPGHGCYAAALTAKGRIVADVRIFALDHPAGDIPAAGAGAAPGWLDGAALVVDVPARAAEGWEALVRKYVNPRVARYQRVDPAVRAFGVYGPRAREALAGAFGAAPSALAALPPYAHATVALAVGETLLVARVPDAGTPARGLDGFVVLVPGGAYDAAWARVCAGAPGVVAGGEAAYTVARVEAGYPEWGLDIDEGTLAPEAALDALGAVSYTKGCYTGQEVVARVHSRGHVNRQLRGLVFADGSGDGAAAALPPHGAALHDAAGAPVGDVRTAVHSPRLGDVALAMVRREASPGAAVEARWTDGAGGEVRRAAVVAELPFASGWPAA